MENNVILITGSAKRLGRTMALAAAQRGLSIAIHYRTAREEARNTVADIEQYHVPVTAVAAELTDHRQVSNMFDTVGKTLGPVRYLINSASVFGPSPLMDTEAYELDHYLSVNLTAQYRVIRNYVEQFKASDGAVVNMLDWRAWKPDPWFMAYNVSKAGFLNMTLNLAADLAPRIRVNGIAPGAILPAEHEARDTGGTIRELPIRRWGTPEEIAATAMFLLLETGYITGQVIPVDGGRHLI